METNEREAMLDEMVEAGMVTEETAAALKRRQGPWDLNERKREVIRSGLDAKIRLSITEPETFQIDLNDAVIHDNAEWVVVAVNREDRWVECDLVPEGQA